MAESFQKRARQRRKEQKRREKQVRKEERVDDEAPGELTAADFFSDADEIDGVVPESEDDSESSDEVS